MSVGSTELTRAEALASPAPGAGISRRLSDERGVTLIELLIVMVLTGIIMTAVVNIFVSGTRAGADANARLTAQENTRVALDRLEYEGRCATSAALVSSGAGVTLTLPSQCTNASGTVTWCVTGGVLERFPSATCSGTSGVVYVRNVSSTTPFSLITASGNLPQLAITITSDATPSPADAATLTDTITLRNAARS
jgi:prepilin-type N-terminal cleavage/methylation domain-containing protein